MSVVLVETYLAKHEKQMEFQKLLQDFLQFKKANPKLFEGLKSWKLFQQEYGSVGNLYIEMWEFENLQDMETISTNIFENQEMKRIQAAFHTLIDHTTFSKYIWKTVA